MAKPATLLEVVRDCDNFPYPCCPHLQTWSSSAVSRSATVSRAASATPTPSPPSAARSSDLDPYSRALSNLWTFHLPYDPAPHGFLTHNVISNMRWTKHFYLDVGNQAVDLLAPSVEDLLPEDNGSWEVACSRILDDQIEIARRDNVLGKILGPKKKGEQFPIVGAKFDVGVDRSAIGLLGMIGRGAHMTVYSRVRSASSLEDGDDEQQRELGKDLRFWIPRRDYGKSTYPGKLDQAVAGGVARGETPWECIVREAVEEAGSALSEEFVRANAKAAGTVTWLNISDRRAGPGQGGLINPGVLYVYDLELPDEGRDFKFEPVPGDIDSWAVMDTDEVMTAMKRLEFKPSCAVVMIDFLVRHGVITAENEPDYTEIVSRLHRLLPLPTSSRREDQREGNGV
ncbi:hypothetical protein B0T13DRAFT_444572 [Neurospora crassa]|nr:hypothetical protein B0T13DRAFT_444572 [Neurospora crassa]